jgi:hypothetical protein
LEIKLSLIPLTLISSKPPLYFLLSPHQLPTSLFKLKLDKGKGVSNFLFSLFISRQTQTTPSSSKSFKSLPPHFLTCIKVRKLEVKFRSLLHSFFSFPCSLHHQSITSLSQILQIRDMHGWVESWVHAYG